MERKQQIILIVVLFIGLVSFLFFGYKIGFLHQLIFPEPDSPQQFISKDVMLSYDNLTWFEVTPPFTTGLKSWSSGIKRVTVCTPQRPWPEPHPDCISNTISYHQTFIEKVSSLCSIYDLQTTCSLWNGKGWNPKENVLYVKKTFSLSPNSKGAWVKIVPSGFSDGLNTDYNTYSKQKFTLEEGSDKGVCYVNNKPITISSQYATNHRIYGAGWGITQFSPYVDITDYVNKGQENVITCILYKDNNSIGNFDFELVTYGDANCQKFHSSAGETLPIDIDFQNNQVERIINQWTKCDFGVYDVYVEDVKQFPDPSNNRWIIQILSSFKGDKDKARLEQVGPKTDTAIGTDFVSYLTFKNLSQKRLTADIYIKNRGYIGTGRESYLWFKYDNQPLLKQMLSMTGKLSLIPTESGYKFLLRSEDGWSFEQELPYFNSLELRSVGRLDEFPSGIILELTNIQLNDIACITDTDCDDNNNLTIDTCQDNVCNYTELECLNDETVTCPDGSVVITKICDNGKYVETGRICPEIPPEEEIPAPSPKPTVFIWQAIGFIAFFGVLGYLIHWGYIKK